MPIKKANLHLYPANWKEISLAAKVRANWRCQHPGCTAEQYAVGHWEKHNAVWRWVPLHGNGPCDAAGQGREWPSMQRLTYSEARQIAAETFWDRGQPEDKPLIVIVLTTAHLNHDPSDCRPEALKVLCQRHHLSLDAPMHQANAQATRRAKAGTLELF